jgi:hypothetical protein
MGPSLLPLGENTWISFAGLPGSSPDGHVLMTVV